MATTTTHADAKAVPIKRDGWVLLLSVTILVNLASFLLFPQFLTDALTLPLAGICGVPVLWGFYSFLSFRTRRERVVGYAAVLPAAGWALAALNLLWQYGWHT
jgi:hypothetical protein